MKDSIYLIFNRNGIKSLLKKTGKMKALPTGNFMAKLNLEVPDEFFEKYIPEVNVVLKKEDVLEVKNPEVKLKQEEKTPLALFFEEIDK